MFRRTKALLAALAVVFSVHVVQAQTGSAVIRSKVRQHFEQYQGEFDLKTIRVERTDINSSGRRLDIYLNQNFSYQRFRPELIESIYSDLRQSLPKDIRNYSLEIHTNGKTIEQLVPNWARKETSKDNLWNDTEYKGKPWVSNESLVYPPSKGLANIHMAVTPSHGLYYDNGDTLWEWQRPPIYCTREDLLTQSFAYPYLIPMLENAGAVVYTARERDWQTNSVIVKSGDKCYREDGSWSTFTAGGYSEDSIRILPRNYKVQSRTARTGNGPGTQMSTAFWIPEIPEDGDYGVYVTYSKTSLKRWS